MGGQNDRVDDGYLREACLLLTRFGNADLFIRAPRSKEDPCCAVGTVWPLGPLPFVFLTRLANVWA